MAPCISSGRHPSEETSSRSIRHRTLKQSRRCDLSHASDPGRSPSKAQQQRQGLGRARRRTELVAANTGMDAKCFESICRAASPGSSGFRCQIPRPKRRHRTVGVLMRAAHCYSSNPQGSGEIVCPMQSSCRQTSQGCHANGSASHGLLVTPEFLSCRSFSAFRKCSVIPWGFYSGGNAFPAATPAAWRCSWRSAGPRLASSGAPLIAGPVHSSK